MWRNQNPPTLLVEIETGAAPVEKFGDSSKKINLELPYDPAKPFPGIYPKNLKKRLKYLCTSL